MTAPLDKQAVLQALRQRLRDNLAQLRASQETVQAGATHVENRAEDPKDMRSTEQSYLARGLAERVEDMTDALARMDVLRLETFDDGARIGLTALVTLEREDGQTGYYFVSPFGGGEKLTVGGATIQVLTPHAPLGRALVGRRCGHELELELPGGPLEATITDVC